MNINQNKAFEEQLAWHDAMDLDLADADLQRLLDAPQQNDETDLQGFDMAKGETWIYPSNLPCRSYQQSITQAALYKNTLVVLPTGLGKTFIAAVIMYNIYRWYPQGKVIFLAPTRPLVAQQIEACKRIMPLHSQDTVELTGKLPRHKRFELWRTKRVFFATPQSVQSDIVGSEQDAINPFPFSQIKLLVIDEAHKAKGRFAYTEVTQAIWRNNRYFRVLALSATPGRSVEDVAEVIQNLFISHLEVRWDNSIDVMPYVHHRSIKTIVVPLGEAIQKVRTELIEIIDPYERQLIDAGVISGSCVNISRNFLLFEQKRFRERSLRETHAQQSTVNSNFSTCVSLYHALELLERHGLRVFVNYFEQDEEGRSKFIYNMDIKLRKLIDRLRSELGPNPFDTSINTMTNGQIAQMPHYLDFGHPKFEQARACLMQHFQQHAESRAIVFCEYRESVLLIYRLLLQHVPVLKPRCFAGHSGTGPLRALTQKQQIQIMKDFREGKSNVLVATSIGEEGLDVGEVELIVCFDISSANPTRFIQRIGRTGRRKNGNVVMLITEGKEQRMLKDVMANKDQTNKKILRSPLIKAALYKQSPRMVPEQLNPVCVQQVVEFCEETNTQAEENPKENGKRKVVKNPKKQPVLEKGSQDLRKFFNKNNNIKNNKSKGKHKSITIIDLDDDNDLEVFDMPAAAGAATQAAMEQSFKERFDAHDLADLCTESNTQLLNVPDFKKRDDKHFRKLNKFFASITPLVPESRRKLEPSAVIKSKNLTKTSKLLMLRHHWQYVLDLCEKMSVLEALETASESNAMCKEEQNVREEYKEMMHLFGGKQALDEFVNKHNTNIIITTPQYDSEEDYLYTEQDYQDSMKSIFQGLEEPLFSRDNFTFIRNEFKKTEIYEKMLNAQEDDIDRSSMREEVDLPEIEDIEDITQLTTDYDSRYKTELNVDDYDDTLLIKQEAENTEISKSLSPIPNTKSLLVQRNSENTKIFKSLSPIPKENTDLSMINCSIEDTTQLMNAWQAFSKCPKSTPINARTCTRRVNRTFEKNNDILGKLNESAEKFEDETPDLLPEVYISAAKNAANKISETTALNMETQLETEALDLKKEHEPNITTDVETQLDSITELEAAELKKQLKPVLNARSTDLDVETELDMDLDMFLEPFPEEDFYTAKTNMPAIINSDSQKENLSTTEQDVLNSPDLFEISEKRVNQKHSLAAKLKDKCFTKPLVPVNKEKTPTKNKQTTAANCIKSPSVFENYWQKVQMNKARRMDAVLNKTKPVYKKEATPKKLAVHSSDSDFEEIAASQEHHSPSILHQRKRRRLCEFLNEEAELSGCERSSDEADTTMGCYMLDSVVVHDDLSEEQKVTSDSRMHAMYLQSVKSPQRRFGGFKIPQYDNFDDHADIFSQTIEDVGPSQYIPDTFVVAEDNNTVLNETREMCPLERAELILKQRRKARKLQAQDHISPTKKRKRKVYIISDSSDEN